MLPIYKLFFKPLLPLMQRYLIKIAIFIGTLFIIEISAELYSLVVFSCTSRNFT